MADGPVAQLFPVSGAAASIRPALIAARKPFQSFSVWSAYATANAPMAYSNAVPVPAYPDTRAGSPARACARASVRPQSEA
jgi:hypothetical protein